MTFGTWRLCMLLPAAALAACSDALIFGERTSFNLAISVNDNAALPLNVNAGLHRSISTLVPPLGGDVQRPNEPAIARGEAVSLVSGFRLIQEGGTAATPFSNDITIKTQFASGEAAVDVSGHPAAVRTIVGGYTGSTVAGSPPAIIRAFRDANRRVNVPIILNCMKQSGLPGRDASEIFDLINTDPPAAQKAVADCISR